MSIIAAAAVSVWLTAAVSIVFAAEASAAIPIDQIEASGICAVPGQDPTPNASGVVNAYWAGSGNLASAATSLVLGEYGGGTGNSVAIGDLLMVIQMQDGEINPANNVTYGDGLGNGKGTTTVGSAGLYEFVRVDGIAGGPGAGGTVTFTPALTNAYVQAPATPTSGQKRYQVVRVPQFAAVTLAGVSAPHWAIVGANTAETGGVVVVDVQGALTLGAGTVENIPNRAIFVAGRGFRGAAGRQAQSNGGESDWASVGPSDGNGGKGEGIAGTPRYVSFKTNDFGIAVPNASDLVVIDSGAEGYPAGDRARGAPGNAGGGGSDGDASGTARNAGGGGGGNYAAGGLGGRPWDAPTNDTNGRGGAGYAGVLAFNRVFLGGGGGGGGTNDGTSDGGTYENAAVGCGIGAGMCSSGASGGGIVILRARSIAGSGIIDVRGAPGYNVGNDAAGGGGAAGSVVLHTVLGGSATVVASGGDGGNAWAGAGGGEGARHGPGGGGGGGLVAYAPTAMAVTADVAGGAPGRTTNGVGDTYEASGFVGGVVTFLPPDVPGIDPGAECGPVLRLAKTNFTDTVVAGSGTTYQLTVSNTGTSATTGTIQVSDFLAEGLSIAPGGVVLSGPNAANWTCNASGSLVTCSSAVVIGPGTASAFAFTVTVGASATHTTNRASVGGGGGSENPTPVDPSTCTGNNTPIGCAVDTDTANAPLLVLQKSHLDPVVAGQSAQYTLGVTNTGSLATSGLITIVDALPAGMSFLSGGGNGFTCSASAQVVTCQGSATIAPAGSVSFPLNVLIAADAAQVLTNRAQVGGGGDPSKPAVPTGSSAAACPAPVPPATSLSEPSTGCASETVTIRRVRLLLDKTDGSASVSIGGQTTYQLTVRNTGDTASLGTIELRDVLPTPFTWAAPLGPVVPTGSNATDWTCTIASATTLACSSSVAIAAGGSSSFSFVADVNAADAGTQYINRARIGGGGDSDLVPSAPDDLEVGACTGSDVPRGCALDLSAGQASPRLRLAKTHNGPQTVLPGGTVTFNLVVSNSSATASNGTITVIDVLPTGLTYVSATSIDGFTCTNSAQVVTCTSTNLLAGNANATITLVASVAPNAAPILTNVGQVGGGGDPTAPTPTPTTTAQCIASGVPYAGCAIDTVPTVPDYDFCPASTSPRVFNVVNGVNIYGYTPGSATPDTLLPLKPQAMTGNLNALMVDPVNNRLLLVERSSSTSTTLWAYDSANGGWYVAAGPVVTPDFPRGGMALNGTGYLIAGGSATPAVWRVQAQAAPSFAYTLAAVGTLTYDVAPTDLGSGDIAIDGEGNGWIAVGQDLYRVNLATFQATRQTRPSLGGSPSTINWAGIAFAPDGTLVLANNNSPSAYYQYNPATGFIVLRVNTTANSSRDLASCAFPTQPVPQLSVVKTLAQVNGAAPGAAVYPGDVLRYAITISNTGGAVATLYPGDVRETLPANTTVVVTGNDFTCTGSNCPNSNAVNVAAGASVTLYFVVRLDTPLPTTQISNAVTIPGQVNCANAPNDCNEVTPVGPRVTMAKTLQSGGPVAQPGGSLVYAISLTNLSGVPTSIPAGTIGETVPLNTTHVAGDSFACAAPAAGSSCSNAAAVAVAANGSSVLTFTVTVANPIPAGVTSIANTALPPPGVTCPSCSVTTPTAANVTVVKALTSESGTQTGVAEPGETLTYTVTLTNSGGTAFANYDFVENVPAGATLASIAGAGVTACATPVVGAGTCPVTVASIPANGSTTVSIVFNLANPLPTGTTSIVNVISGGDIPPGCTAPNLCSVTTPAAANVTVAKALASESGTQTGVAEPGETLTYTVTLSNSGGTAFANYDFVENVPAGATLSSITGAGVTACATPVVGAGTCPVTVASVPANGSTTVSIVFNLANPLPTGTTSIVNLISGGDIPPGCTAPNLCSVTTPTAANVTVVKALTSESGTQTGVAEPGETLTYTVTLSNSGGTAFANYDFVENVPAGATLSAITGAGVTACATPVVGAGTCPVTVASVPANGSTTVSILFNLANPLPTGATSIVNLISGGDIPPGCTAPNLCLVTTPTAANVTVVKALTSESGTQTGVAEPGETLTYTVTLSNSGGTAFANYDFVENVPAGATLASVTGAGVTACATPLPGAGACPITVASVPANGSTTVSIVFNLANPLPTGTTSITNLISGGDIPPGCTAPNVCSVTTPMAANVTVVKALTSESGTQTGFAEPGETLTYTVTLTNSGGTAFANYDFVENVPAGATLASVTGAGVTACATPLPGAGACPITVASVPASGSTTVSIVFNLANPLPTGTTSIVNLINGGDIPPGCTAPNLCSVTTPTAANVTVVKALTAESGTQAGVAEPGETLTYTVTLSNSGGTAFTNYDFVENVPAGATLASVTGAGVTACATPLAGAGTCPVTVASVPANGSTTVSIVFNLANPLPTGTTSIVNLISGGDIPPGCTAPNLCSVTTPTAANVTVVKALTSESGTQTGVAEPGETLTYTVTLSNSGGTAFANYDFVENVPAGATLASVSGFGLTTCATPVVGPGTCAITVGNVLANGSTTVTIVFTVANPLPAGTTSILNLISGGDILPGCTAPNVCSVTTPTAANVTVVKALTTESGSQTGVAEPGETLTYTVTLSNSGGTAFANYDFTENVPVGATLASITGTGVTACAPPVVGAGTCPVTVASVPANGSTTVTIVFTVANPLPAGTANITNLISGGDVPPGCTAPNLCSVTTPTAANVTVVKALTSESGSQTGVAEPGETLTYTVTLTNSGGSAFTNYDFTENVPTGATLSAITGTGVTACATPVVGAGTCPVTVASVPANGSTTVTIVFTVADPLPAGTANITNLISGGDVPPGCTAPNVCSVTTPTAANVTIVKALTSESGSQTGVAEPGETLTYTVTLSNNGGTAFTNYDFVENVPVGATLSAITGAGVTTSACALPVTGAGTCNVTVASVPANGSTTVTIVFNLATPLPTGTTSIVNLVNGGDTVCTAPNVCSVTTPTSGRVAITKTVADASGNGIAEPGEALTWTITLSNSGGTPVTGYGLTDPLDANTTFSSATNGGVHAGGIVSWTNLTVPAQSGPTPGVLVLTVVTTVNTPIPDGVRVIANLAYATGGTPPDCSLVPTPSNCASLPTAARLTVAKALSGESLTADGIAEPGETLTYTITLRNHGGTVATGVIVNETVPQHTTFVSGTPGWTCAAGAPAGTACDSVVTVPAADSGGIPGVTTLTFVVTVLDPLPAGATQITNAVALDDGTPPNCTVTPNDPACVVMPTINLTLVKSVESVTATGPGTYWVAYRIDLANTGGSPASYTLTDTPDFTPLGVTVTGSGTAATISGTLNPALPGGAFAVANGTAVQISASGVTLAAGGTHSYTVRIPIAVSGNVGNAQCTGAPGNGLYNRAAITGTFARESSTCAPVSGNQALIRLIKSVRLGVDANGDHYGNVGDVLHYTFAISNPGTVTLSAIDLIDPRVADLQCDTTTAYGEPLRVLRGDELFFGPFEDARGGQLEPGDSILCGATYTITAQDVLNRRVVNTATTHGAGTGGQVVTSTSTAIYTNIR